MIICGIKSTHDGALALIDNGKLIFSYEMEKLANNHRHKEFCLTMNEIEDILQSYGYELGQVDRWVLDGWRGDKLGTRCIFKDVPFLYEGKKVDISLAQYGHLVQKEENILKQQSYELEEINFSYDSYPHVAGHILGAYCSSPFAKAGEDAFVLVWDGGMPPQLFYYQTKENKVSNLGPIMYLLGCIYVDFPHKFEPYCNYKKHVSIAGKLMAYIALGEARPAIVEAYNKIYDEITASFDLEKLEINNISQITDSFIDAAKEYADTHSVKHQDILMSLHAFLQERLVKHLEDSIKKYPDFTKNLCFAGGNALNIKWNSAIRQRGIIKNLWVPPFPNDSGSALGVACCAMVKETPLRALDWDVYSGPQFIASQEKAKGFKARSCSLEELALILHETNEPVLFLQGRAEIGPRALGNRSILAAPASPNMKELLNELKVREGYRPVAPICLEEDAPKVFSPGTPDPFMLFEHLVKKEWKDKVPAIVHLDGSSRLQTVNEKENKPIYDLLTYYKEKSGIPLLCNTSANLNGAGFFPDLKTAIEWGRVNYIWSEGILYAAEVSFSPLKVQSIH
jgi:carbamoyltransferase